MASALGGAPERLGVELHRHAGESKAFADGLRASGAAAEEAGEAAVEDGGGGDDHRAANTPALALLSHVLSQGALNHCEQMYSP